jgi:uncharacterized membrane protein
VFSFSGSAIVPDQTRYSPLLRAISLVYSLVFLASFLQNIGLRLTVGPVDFYFSEPVWQAGIGEAVIGVLLFAAAIRDWMKLYWIAYLLSVVGIVIGLTSSRVVGAAREIHILLVPLACLGIALLVWRQYRTSAR